MYVIDNTGNGVLNYTFGDHLGSLTEVVNSSTGAVMHQSFDAWGNTRSAADWRNASTVPLFASRGFTGHEHLEAFALINMNGRMYDPVLGRFLSPDPYVQMPDFSQNFNRYSYCLNNPLVFSDPDGECLVPFLIGAAISVVANGISNNIHDQPFFQGAVVAGVVGGVGGVFASAIGAAASTMTGLGRIAFQTGMHGYLGGIMNGATGGSFGQGFVSGSLGSLAGLGASSSLNNSSKGVQAFGTIASGGLIGGGSAEICGGNFWDGFRNGAISSTLNHAIHTGSLGEGLMMASITGKTRHLFGPDAISFSGTFDVVCGLSLGFEKGGLAVLRGEEAGVYSLNDISAGIGGLSVSGGAEFVKLYSSATTVLKSQFYGPRYEANFSLTAVNVSVGATAVYATHAQGFTIGLGYTVGVDAMPVNVGVNINRGTTTEYFYQLSPEIKKAFQQW